MIQATRTRFHRHLSRKIFHMSSGTALAFSYASFLSREQVQGIALGALAVLLPLDLLRLRWPALNRLVFKIFSSVMRQGEEHALSAQFHYVLGLAFGVFLLPKPLAIQALLTLAWMDPVAALYGQKYGRTSWSEGLQRVFVGLKKLPAGLGAKTIAGSLAGWGAAFLAGVFAWTGIWAEAVTAGGVWVPSPVELALLSGSGASAAVLAEAWPSQWDDNFRIPVWTSVAVVVTVILLRVPLAPS